MSENDQWKGVKRRHGTVVEHGPGVLGGGSWQAKATVYLAKEVDAARAAVEAQHRQEIVTLSAMAETNAQTAEHLSRVNVKLREENNALLAAARELRAERDNQYAQAVEATQRALLAEQALANVEAERDSAVALAVTLEASRNKLFVERDRLRTALRALKE